jgi:hypothetical protein
MPAAQHGLADGSEKGPSGWGNAADRLPPKVHQVAKRIAVKRFRPAMEVGVMWTLIVDVVILAVIVSLAIAPQEPWPR